MKPRLLMMDYDVLWWKLNFGRIEIMEVNNWVVTIREHRKIQQDRNYGDEKIWL
jgi:hypothetical protein